MAPNLSPGNQLLVTTAFELPNCRIVQSLGFVRGIVVRSRSIVGNIIGMLHTIIGGNITVYTTLCEHTRADAYQEMVIHAKLLGANAIIGMRYDTTELAYSVTEVLCYGTAVIVKPTT